MNPSSPSLHHSSDSDDEDYDTILMRSKPRQQTFELSSPPPSSPPTPSATTPITASSYLQPQNNSSAAVMDDATTPSRTRSFLNLTTSTLFGIYSQTGFTTEREEMATPSTPWGTGAMTPISRQNSLDLSRADKVLSNGNSSPSSRTHKRRRSPIQQHRVHRKPRRGFKGYYLPLIARAAALFAVGVLYGLLITHLHDRQELAPIKVDINRSSWAYLTWWGLAGVALGEAMPWVDTFWAPDEEDSDDRLSRSSSRDESRINRGGLDGYIDIVRSIGAFVGVAYAIRKLPWQSTLQLSLTLALANPAIWFIVDRSPPGFVLSTCFSLLGTLVLLGMNPALMPSPSPAEVLRAHVMRNGGLKQALGSSGLMGGGGEEMVLGIFTQESVGVATWIASVLFVSSVCFGNIGRRLVPQD